MRFALFFLFVFSGLLKWLPWPYDPTVLFGALALVAFLAGGRNWLSLRPEVVPPVVLLSLFLIWYLATGVYTSSNTFFLTKSLGIVLSLSAFWASLSLGWTAREMRWLVGTLIAAGMVGGALLVLLFSEDRLSVFTDPMLRSRYPNSLAVGDLLATTCIAIMFGARRWPLHIPTLAACLFGLVVLGGRGPLLGLALSVAVGLALRRTGNRQLVFYLPVVIALLFTFGRTLLADDSGVNRLLHSLDDGGQQLTNSRIEVMTDTWTVFRNNPVLGTGIGSLGVELINIDMTASPHNLFVEAAAETGLIGFVLFAAGIVASVFVVIPIRESRVGTLLLVLLNYELFEFMKSGDFIDARKLFFFLSLAISYRSHLLQNKPLEPRRDSEPSESPVSGTALA